MQKGWLSLTDRVAPIRRNTHNNKKIIKENDYFELFVEEQGVFEVDVYISESEEMIRNIHEVEIICKYM